MIRSLPGFGIGLSLLCRDIGYLWSDGQDLYKQEAPWLIPVF